MSANITNITNTTKTTNININTKGFLKTTHLVSPKINIIKRIQKETSLDINTFKYEKNKDLYLNEYKQNDYKPVHNSYYDYDYDFNLELESNRSKNESRCSLESFEVIHDKEQEYDDFIKIESSISS